MRLTHKNIWVHVALFSAVGTLTFLIFLKVLVSEKKEVVVPTLVGKTLTQARQQLLSLGLDAKTRAQEHRFLIPFGVVIEQDINAGEVVMEGRTMGLTISAGLDPDWKQNVEGIDVSQSMTYLSRQNVPFVNQFDHCGVFPENHVISAFWDETKKEMRLLVAKGACPKPWILKHVQSVDYVGMMEKELKSRGMDVRRLGSMDVRDDIITDPLPGSVIRAGDYVIVRNQP